MPHMALKKQRKMIRGLVKLRFDFYFSLVVGGGVGSFWAPHSRMRHNEIFAKTKLTPPENTPRIKWAPPRLQRTALSGNFVALHALMVRLVSDDFALFGRYREMSEFDICMRLTLKMAPEYQIATGGHSPLRAHALYRPSSVAHDARMVSISKSPYPYLLCISDTF